MLSDLAFTCARSEPEVSLRYGRELMDLAEQLGSLSGMALAHNHIGLAYRYTGRYQESLEHALESLRIREELGQPAGLAGANNNLGVLHWRLEEYERALVYLKRALELRRQSGAPNKMLPTLNNIALVYLSQGKLELASECYEEILDILEKSEDNINLDRYMTNMAELQLEMGNTEQALVYSRRSIELKQAMGDQSGLAAVLFVVGRAHRARGDLERSREILEEGLKLALEHHNLNSQKEIYLALSEVEADSRRYQEALEHHRKFAEIRGQLFSEDRARRIGQLQAGFELEQKEHEITLLKTEQSLHDLEIERQRSIRNLLAALLVLAVALGATGIVLYRITNRAKKALGRRNEELRTLDRIVRSINREVDLPEVMRTLLEQGLGLLPQAFGGAFIGCDSSGETYEVKAVSGWDPAQTVGISFRADEAFERYLGEPAAEGVFIVRDAQNRPGASKVLHLQGASSLVSVDLTVDDQVLGFLVFDLSTDAAALGPSDLRRLSRYRQHAINALAKARLVGDLEKANRAKSAFLASMSHELRTPLTSIIGFSDVISKNFGSEMPARYRKFLANIAGSGQHLLALINDILDLSKVEAGRMPLELGEVSISQTLESVCRTMEGMLSNRGVGLIQEVPADLPPVVLDGGKLRQILFNLVSNAVKYSPDDSVVVVSAGILATPPGSSQSEILEITVRDQGAGIKPEDQRRLFDEFVRMDNEATRSAGGSGLGLALVKRFVEMQGGSIMVESQEGQGSTFRIHLPRDVSRHLGQDLH